MANREELGIIRGARAGDADCQLALGKLYLFGGASLPLNVPTALHWLARAARQERDDAWRLIGNHIPFEIARNALPEVLCWYQRASDAGSAAAALVLAELQQTAPPASMPVHHQPLPECGARPSILHPAAAPALPTLAGDLALTTEQAAQLEQLWRHHHAAFLQQARSLLRPLLARAPADAEAARMAEWQAGPQLLGLLARCAALLPADGVDAELQHCRELAAHGGERNAQLALGLWFARMDSDGKRQGQGIAAVNFKRAIRWLTLAGEQGLAEAWFALSRIYLKPEFSQRCVAEAQGYLERAADMGHCAAQLECGMYAWRNRRTDQHSDVRAAYWLQKAASQGCPEAEAALARVAAAPKELDWMTSAITCLTRELSESQPLLAARLELAALFGLSRAEALLLDVKAADHGHCLVVDIRASYGRSKRRLVLLRTARERQALDRIVRLFESIDSGPDGLEGNYRQRLYRLKTWLPDDLMAA
ncbi:sel1 repeat family protein [Duganella dendranthematis]|jgi:TPR repeat protein|uniref:Sel1 repeat family protein n=1 Tax=Duganella dendranthematis TaxID=2728021 RepID=A0ABX6M9P5_9BURK|nr:SEL1-like repeat protein [Duganella dendranthematis]QJD90840.1 sel1 repeat family protein [Duganella dendranthematis]